MGTLHRLVAGAKKRRFYVPMWLTFAAMLGFVSAVFTIAGKHVSIIQAAILALISLIVASLINRKALLAPQLSVDDVILGGIESLRRSSVKCPCEETLAQQAKMLAANCYGDNVTIQPNRYDSIRLKNPNVLACLRGEDGSFQGYFDVLPLKDSFAEVFLAGKVAEDQITHEDVCTPSESASCRYIFISGLAVCEPESFAGRRNASILVWALLSYLRRFYSNGHPIAFAVAATEEGDDLLNRFRLNVTASANSRTDHYKLYTLRLSEDELDRRLACLPDWNELCSVDWQVTQSVRQEGSRLPQMHTHSLGTIG